MTEHLDKVHVQHQGVHQQQSLFLSCFFLSSCFPSVAAFIFVCSYYIYRGADKSLARPWKKTSYSDQDLQHYTEIYGVQTTGIYSCCLYATSLSI